MTRQVPEYLRLFQDSCDDQAAPAPEAITGLHEFFQAFERATGWSLHHVAGRDEVPNGELPWSTPIAAGSERAPGYLTLGLPVPDDDATDWEPITELSAARQLAAAAAGLIGELLQTRQALRQRDAELAASVPTSVRAADPERWADQLEAVLRSGAQAIGATAAVMYALDESTTRLNPRAAWNLPAARRSQPGRELATATADLEALCGHAVVVENQSSADFWCPPERCKSAICVPVSSTHVPLGTLWLLFDEFRPLSDEVVNIAELTAGRLAAEMEREVLTGVGREAQALERQLTSAERAQRNQLPTMKPLVEGWEIAGWTARAGRLGGDFHDWWMRDDALMVAIGDCVEGGIEGALCASNLRATLRAWGQQPLLPNQLLGRTNQALWGSSAGDQYASLFCAALNPTTGECQFANAGDVGALLLTAAGCERLTAPMLQLGTDPAAMYLPRELMLSPGELLILATDGVYDSPTLCDRGWNLARFMEVVTGISDRGANAILAAIQAELSAFGPPMADQTVLVVRRQ